MPASGRATTAGSQTGERSDRADAPTRRTIMPKPRAPRSPTSEAQADFWILDELLPAALHVFDQYANNVIEADHGKLKSRLRPMRGLKRFRSAQVISAGHAFVQNLRRSHYELATDVASRYRLTTAFASSHSPSDLGA